jgi:hypothetical protein
MDAVTWRSLTSGLAPGQRGLVDELMELLSRLQPPQLIAEEMTFQRANGSLLITLPHHTQRDYAIRVEATQRGATVRFGNGAKEIYAFEGFLENVSWSTLVVGCIDELLHGKREVRTTFRGTSIVRVEVYDIDEKGRMSLASAEERPRRAREWRPFARALIEVRRVSYMDPLEHA